MTRPDEKTLRTAANEIIAAMEGKPIVPEDGWVFASLTLAREWLREHPEAVVGFDDFWGVWPYKVARADALKAWKALKPSAETREKIFADVSARKSSAKWLEAGGKFIPHPASYLRGRRWEDEVVSVPTSRWPRGNNAAADVIDQAAAAMQAAGTGGTPLG